MRETFGDEVLLQVDANTAYELSDARQLAKLMLGSAEVTVAGQPDLADAAAGVQAGEGVAFLRRRPWSGRPQGLGEGNRIIPLDGRGARGRVAP